MPRVLFACLAAFCLLTLAACGPGEMRKPEPGEKLRVMAATPHLAGLAMAIAGDDAEVEMLPPEDVGAHDYDPTVADRRRLEKAHLLLINGLELETFRADRLARAARMTLIDCSAGISKGFLIASDDDHDHGHAHDHAHGAYNPHIWLSVDGALHQAGAIAKAFADIDPDNADAYNRRLDELKERLYALRDEYRPKLGELTRRNFVSNHDAFPYFAREFGLKQVGVVQRSPGHDPTVEERRQLEKQIREQNAQAIFMEPGYDDAASRTIAESTGLPLAVLDPLDMGKPAPDGLERVLRKNLETVLKTLGD